MFKDSLPSYQLPQPNDLSVPPKHEVEQIVSFIDNHMQIFHTTIIKIKILSGKIGLATF